MVFKSQKGYYQLIANFKKAFDIEIFEQAYVEECFDRYPYIVGDLSDGKLRLKGFTTDDKDKNNYKNINNYIENSCVFEAPYYILKRISSDKEYENIKAKDQNKQDIDAPKHLVINKENFDKESLILETSNKNKPRINLDLERINKVKIGTLPPELKEDNDDNKEKVTTVVASEGFIPVQRQPRYQNNRNNKPYNRKRENNAR